MKKPAVYEVEVTSTHKVAIGIDLVADWFWGLSDEEQADFFIAVAKKDQGAFKGSQWFYVGRHLRDCACSTDDARDMIRMMSSAMEPA